EGVVDQEGPIDPAIAAVTILDPGEDVIDTVEKSGHLKPLLLELHDCDTMRAFHSPRLWINGRLGRTDFLTAVEQRQCSICRTFAGACLASGLGPFQGSSWRSSRRPSPRLPPPPAGTDPRRRRRGP